MSEATFSDDFALLVRQHLTQAVWFCGYGAEGKQRDLELAKKEIAILEVLQAKTKGNLTADEERLLADALHEARMAFVWAVHKGTPEKVGENTQQQPVTETKS